MPSLLCHVFFLPSTISSFLHYDFFLHDASVLPSLVPFPSSLMHLSCMSSFTHFFLPLSTFLPSSSLSSFILQSSFLIPHCSLPFFLYCHSSCSISICISLLFFQPSCNLPLLYHHSSLIFLRPSLCPPSFPPPSNVLPFLSFTLPSSILLSPPVSPSVLQNSHCPRFLRLLISFSSFIVFKTSFPSCSRMNCALFIYTFRQ